MQPSGTHGVTLAAREQRKLRGRMLLITRIALGALFISAFTLFAISIPFERARDTSICQSIPCPGLQLDTASVGALHGLGLSLDFYGAYVVALEALLVAVYGGVAALITWRRSDDRAALFAAITLLTSAVAAFNPSLGALRAEQPGWAVPIAFLTAVGGVGFICFCYAFPDGRFLPWWTRWSAASWSLLYLPHALLPDSQWDIGSRQAIVQIVFWACFLATVIAAQIYRFRRVSTPLQRQQAKWVLLDLLVGCLGLVGVALAVLVSVPRSGASALFIAALFGLPVLYVAFLLIPVSIVIAMLRYRLFDIDVLINRTLVYGSLTVTLALVYSVCVVALQTLLGLLGGLPRDSQVTVIVSTLVSAALFQPARRSLQSIVDRRFYRSKYDTAQTLAAFARTLHEEVDLPTLIRSLLGAVEETMQPAHVSLWLRRQVEDQRLSGADVGEGAAHE